MRYRSVLADMARPIRTVQGIVIVDTEWRGLSPSFYPDGKLRHALLDHQTEIQGYPMCCEVAFYPSGNLKCGRLAKPISIRGVEYYDYIYLYEDGKLHSSKLYKAAEFERYHFLESQYVDFDPEGDVIAGCLATGILNLNIPGKSFIRFDSKRTPYCSLIETEYKSWTAGRYGTSISELEIVSWTNDQFGGVGSSCTFRDFLQGTLNEVVQSDMPEIYPVIHELALQRNTQISDIRPEVKLIM